MPAPPLAAARQGAALVPAAPARPYFFLWSQPQERHRYHLLPGAVSPSRESSAEPHMSQFMP